MDLGPLRALALEVNFAAHGVDVIVMRPSPDETPIETRGIWLTSTTEGFPVSAGLSRQEPVRIMALRRDEVPTVPRGTLIVAPEKAGDADKGWRVDSLDRVEADHQRVIVREDPDALPS